MARAYTAELRDRVLRACERGGPSRARVAALFGVGESTLYRWRRTWQVEGRPGARAPARGRGRRPARGEAARRRPSAALGGAALDAMKGLVTEGNDRTPAEYAAGLRGRAGV